MVGGTTSGYWATGSSNHATMPRMIVTIESTAAKIGRSMKKRASTSAAPGGGGGRGGRVGRLDGHVLRRDRDARPHALHARDDHAVVGRQPRAHDAQALVQRPDRDGAALRAPVRAHDPHEALALVRA